MRSSDLFDPRGRLNSNLRIRALTDARRQLEIGVAVRSANRLLWTSMEKSRGFDVT